MAEETVTLRELARRLGISTRRAYRVIDTGSIRRVELPGLSPRYLACDVAALASKSIVSGPRPTAGRAS